MINIFSSNQVLEISSSFAQLQTALEFALKMSGDSKFVYQVTEDGRYRIWKLYDKPKYGWNKFQFDFDTNIVSQIIIQFLSKQNINYEDDGDGGYNKGFIMKAISEYVDDGYGIVEFKPFVCFYSK